MIIIVEGTDGAGKTSLINALKTQLRDQGVHAVRVLHAGPIKDDPFAEYVAPLVNHAPPNPSAEVILCDRWHVGELVYGPLLRGKTEIDTATWRSVQLFLQKLGAFQVQVAADDRSIVERITRRGDDLVTPSVAVEAQRAYQSLRMTHTWQPDRVITDARSEDLDKLIERAFIKQLAAMRTWKFSSYTGSGQPKYLLLGDHYSPNKAQHERYPMAFTPSFPRVGCSAFLLNALPDRMWQHTGIANANNEENLHTLWKQLGYPNVVSLGTRSHLRCDQFDVPHRSVLHPQFVNRFQHSYQQEYGEMIYQAATCQSVRS